MKLPSAGMSHGQSEARNLIFAATSRNESERWCLSQLSHRESEESEPRQFSSAQRSTPDKGSPRWYALQDAERHARISACAADAEYRDCSCRSAKREAQSLPHKINPLCRPRALMPNPSFKRSANGRPPSPGRRYAVHFRQPGLGVLPSSPA